MTYPYQGLPLTPVIMSELVVELYSGKTVEREQLICDCVRVHFERGGKQARSIKLADTAFKALKQLRSKGMATNVSIGTVTETVSLDAGSIRATGHRGRETRSTDRHLPGS